MDIYRSKYKVESTSRDGIEYTVTCDRENGNGPKINWTCTCPDHKYRGGECKHIREVKYSYYAKEPICIVVLREYESGTRTGGISPTSNVLRIPTDVQNALKIVQDATKAGMTFTAKYEFNILTMTLGPS